MELQNIVNDVPDLPPDVVAMLLQHVSPKERLTVCALVCQSWRAIAAASITSMSRTCTKQLQATNAFEWLTKYGSNVKALHMAVSDAAERLCLDCSLQSWSWLKDLRLTGFNLRQGPSPSDFSQYTPELADALARTATLNTKSTTRLGQLTCLTWLDLESRSSRVSTAVQVLDGCAAGDDLVAVSSLTDLLHLTLSMMTHNPTGFSAMPFKSLKNLTHLHIGVDVTDVSCCHLSCLTNLQELHVSKYAAISHNALAHIEQLQQLTLVRVHCMPFGITPTRVPGFSHLSGLKTLEVRECKELNPLVLQHMTGLRHLGIIDTPINKRGLNLATAAGVPVLLALLPAMQQLTYLNLTDCLSWPQHEAQYAALTASTNLARLILRSGYYADKACRHMFPEGHKLPHLTQLVYHTNWPHIVTLDAGDLGRVVSCCPALQHLDVDLGRQSPEQLAPLQKLTALTLVAASGVGDQAVPVLAALTSLKHLELDSPNGLTYQGLRALTALQALTHLRVQSSKDTASTPALMGFLLRSSPGRHGKVKPDVAKQLAGIVGSAHSHSSQQGQQGQQQGHGGSMSCGQESSARHSRLPHGFMGWPRAFGSGLLTSPGRQH